MKPSAWRPAAILALGLLALFAVPVSRTLFGDAVPEIWVQVIAVAGALLLLWQEWRSRSPGERWRLVAILGGVLVLLWLSGVAFLWLIWPK